VLAKEVSLSPKLLQSCSLHSRSCPGSPRLPRALTTWLASSFWDNGRIRSTASGFDLIPTQQLMTAEELPVLGGLKMMLCSVENAQLTGQTYYSDGAPLRGREEFKKLFGLRCRSPGDLPWPCRVSFTHQFQHSWPECAIRALTTRAQGPHQDPRKAFPCFLGQHRCLPGSFTSRARAVVLCCSPPSNLHKSTVQTLALI